MAIDKNFKAAFASRGESGGIIPVKKVVWPLGFAMTKFADMMWLAEEIIRITDPFIPGDQAKSALKLMRTRCNAMRDLGQILSGKGNREKTLSVSPEIAKRTVDKCRSRRG